MLNEQFYPRSNNEGIPLEATFKTINPLDRRLANNVFQIKVFAIPFVSVEKRKPPQLDKIDSII